MLSQTTEYLCYSTHVHHICRKLCMAHWLLCNHTGVSGMVHLQFCRPRRSCASSWQWVVTPWAKVPWAQVANTGQCACTNFESMIMSHESKSNRTAHHLGNQGARRAVRNQTRVEKFATGQLSSMKRIQSSSGDSTNQARKHSYSWPYDFLRSVVSTKSSNICPQLSS